MGPVITWYGHDAFALSDGNVRIYIDPWKLPDRLPPADILCISHEHHDHCSVEDFSKIAKDDTDILAPGICSEKLLNGRLRIVKPGEVIELRGIRIETVPAYNTDKDFHPREDDRVGFIITIGGQRVYHAGDTDVIPEMNNIRCDIALLPVSGTYVMTAEEAAEAVRIIKPKVAIPMHYGTLVGSREDAERFAALVGTTAEVRILEPART